jgi:hypothetical protein
VRAIEREIEAAADRHAAKSLEASRESRAYRPVITVS